MAHGGEAPHTHHQYVADARAEFVDETAGEQQADCVGDLKCIDDVAVIYFGQADAVFESWLEERDNLTVHVVDGGCGEEHGADCPAGATEACAIWRQGACGVVI